MAHRQDGKQVVEVRIGRTIAGIQARNIRGETIWQKLHESLTEKRIDGTTIITYVSMLLEPQRVYESMAKLQELYTLAGNGLSIHADKN